MDWYNFVKWILVGAAIGLFLLATTSPGARFQHWCENDSMVMVMYRNHPYCIDKDQLNKYKNLRDFYNN